MNAVLVTPIRLAAMLAETNHSQTTPGMRPNATTSAPGVGQKHYWSLVLLFIPLATIVGNLLVIISIIKVKTLHSAINHLILGLAMADLMVACAVMPYAVYVEVNNSIWTLGSFLCDIYCASDVACSTASILTLTVISFDRYRAVTQPIQYSRQTQNSRRVVLILAAVWFISLATASPMVFGLNAPPDGAVPDECRFYNADFLIFSSIISFGIPVVIVLFVYARILVVLSQREKNARRRRAPQMKSKRKNEDESMMISNVGSKEDDSSAVEEDEEFSAQPTQTPPPVDPQPSSRRGTVSSLPDESKYSSTMDEVQSGTTGCSFKSTTSNFLVTTTPQPSKENKNNSAPNSIALKRKMNESFISAMDSSIYTLSTSVTEELKETPTDKPGVGFLDTEDLLTPDMTPSKAPLAVDFESLSPDSPRVRRRSLSESCKELMEQMIEEENEEEVEKAAEPPIKEGILKIASIKCPSDQPILAKHSAPAQTMLDQPQRKTTRAKLQRSLTTVMRKTTWINGNLASPAVRIARRRESDMRKKVAKQQRKEKKATKTLGIVVGIFLLCWLPFFALNILNAVCIKLDVSACQVGFLPFFLTTWLGYMNSFMNPIIYTVFNTEFRKAFKMILCPGRYKRQMHGKISTVTQKQSTVSNSRNTML